WRLAAQELEEPAPGLDARQRGALLHDLMKYLWGSLKNSKALEKDLEPAIASAAAAAVKENGLEGRFAELERERLARLAREWLEIEKARAPFEVAALEERRTLNVAGLELSGRIDRMDRLEKGGHALIDYKTGQATRNAWLGERPDDPQLPLYAVSAPERIDAVAFARLNPGEMAFRGFSKEKNILPKVELYRDWRGLHPRRVERAVLGLDRQDARLGIQAPVRLLGQIQAGLARILGGHAVADAQLRELPFALRALGALARVARERDHAHAVPGEAR